MINSLKKCWWYLQFKCKTAVSLFHKIAISHWQNTQLALTRMFFITIKFTSTENFQNDLTLIELSNVKLFNAIKTLRLRQNGCHFSDNIFKCNFFNENVFTSIGISLMFVPQVPVDNNIALVQIMAWHWTGDKPLSDDTYMCHSASMSLRSHYAFIQWDVTSTTCQRY